MFQVSSTSSKSLRHAVIAVGGVTVLLLRHATIVLLLLLSSRVRCGCSLGLGILVVGLRVLVVLPVGLVLVWVLLEGDVLHGHLERLMQSSPHREYEWGGSVGSSRVGLNLDRT